MTVLLDFDRTIFDTDTFIDYCFKKLPSLKDHIGEELELAALANSHILNGNLRFEPGELRQFLYPDVMAFLEKRNPQDLAILTWGNEDLQRSKVESTGIVDRFSRVVYTSELKGHAIKKLLPLPQPIVFVDDDGMQLDSVAAEVPEVMRVWMRRVLVRAAPTVDCTPVESMEELDAFLGNLS